MVALKLYDFNQFCSNYFGKAFKLFSPNLKDDDINAGERCFLAMVQCI